MKSTPGLPNSKIITSMTTWFCQRRWKKRETLLSQQNNLYNLTANLRDPEGLAGTPLMRTL
jgi:hypothetical protein